MGNSATNEIQGDSKMHEARRLMETALGFLDESVAPADIGAHLDAAICRLNVALFGAETASSGGANTAS